MKQLQALPSDAASAVPARRAATAPACAPRAAWKALGSDLSGLASLAEVTSPVDPGHTSFGTDGRMAITTNAHRRPRETPT